MSAGPWILIDDGDTGANSITFNGPWTRQTKVPQMLLGTSTTCGPVPQNASSLQVPGLSFLLSGVTGHLDVYGQIMDGGSMNFSWTGTPTTPVVPPTSGDASVKSGLIWSTDIRNNEDFFLQMNVVTGSVNIDYLLLTPVPETFLLNKNIIVDDPDPYITYNGNWTMDNGQSTSFGSPFNGTKTGSTTKGDTAFIDFYGGSIGIYAALKQANGRLSFNYSLDGTPPTSVSVYNGSQQVDGDASWLLNQELLYKPLSDARHNLTITVDEVTESQGFWLDYVIFTGIGSTATTPPALSASNNSNSSSSNARPNIWGPVIGVVALIIVIFIGCCCCRCRIRGDRYRQNYFSETVRMNEMASRTPSRFAFRPSNTIPSGAASPPPPYALSAPPSQTIYSPVLPLVPPPVHQRYPQHYSPPSTMSSMTQPLLTNAQPFPTLTPQSSFVQTPVIVASPLSNPGIPPPRANVPGVQQAPPSRGVGRGRIEEIADLQTQNRRNREDEVGTRTSAGASIAPPPPYEDPS
ncbi:hypothetical protein BDN72DRAFT_904366 [Pluteus cervinus]|uniref:Uncharacterized protein n=1 Tax=Pluteus cervinus TaxID=181527 RepID=A0ACD3A643_9AGAR|nr:hypothetical protein BDN72DRAFT_904366 [Pluteus cervinus]